RAPNQHAVLVMLALEPMRSAVVLVGQRPVDLPVGLPGDSHDLATAHANGAPHTMLVIVGDLDDRMRRSRARTLERRDIDSLRLLALRHQPPFSSDPAPEISLNSIDGSPK